jgi:hypothetical protein
MTEDFFFFVWFFILFEEYVSDLRKKGEDIKKILKNWFVGFV